MDFLLDDIVNVVDVDLSDDEQEQEPQSDCSTKLVRPDRVKAYGENGMIIIPSLTKCRSGRALSRHSSANMALGYDTKNSKFDSPRTDGLKGIHRIRSDSSMRFRPTSPTDHNHNHIDSPKMYLQRKAKSFNKEDFLRHIYIDERLRCISEESNISENTADLHPHSFTETRTNPIQEFI